ncbi:hypothetical protein LZ30DRAFT_700026 [Colletotrichum cereale]|nr:hypothetical protein LZ30DRAFT_700026 [Colletotrichum cereale]
MSCPRSYFHRLWKALVYTTKRCVGLLLPYTHPQATLNWIIQRLHLEQSCLITFGSSLGRFYMNMTSGMYRSVLSYRASITV